MIRQLWRTNFADYFEDKAAFIASRHTGYQQDVLRIRDLAVRAQKPDIHALICYLRPWNLEAEGNWIGREWIRLVAMQTLCYLGVQDPAVEAYLFGTLSSSESEWSNYDNALRDTWKRYTDTSCLADPYMDFLRCLKELLECIAATKEDGDPASDPMPQQKAPFIGQ